MNRFQITHSERHGITRLKKTVVRADNIGLAKRRFNRRFTRRMIFGIKQLKAKK